MKKAKKSMIFNNRQEVAMKLIPYLEKYKNESCIVFAVPRGGVPIGYQIAKNFHFPLELLMTKKIGHPNNAEVAVGSVSMEDFLTDPRYHLPETYINAAVLRIREAMKIRYKKYAGDHKPVSAQHKTIIITDDGIATGYTLFAAIKMIRKKHPEKIVVAVPVAPSDTAEKIREEVDDFICLHEAEDFQGVGQYYKDFSEVSDDEVIKMMKDA